MKIMAIILILFFLSCQTGQEKQAIVKQAELKNGDTTINRKNDNHIHEALTHFTFFDSILMQDELSLGQIRKSTIIDSIYYTGMYSRATFEGDTVFNFKNGLKGAIIIYEDRLSCKYKFLLVFDSSKKINLNYKLIYTDCDQDESADYTSLRYKILNDSIFETIETYIPEHNKKKATEKIKWKLSISGAIDSVSQNRY